MMGRCRDCVWWLTHEEFERRRWDPDLHALFDGAYRLCEMTPSRSEGPVQAHSLAYATDAEQYFAILVTHADFGCTQFKPKAEES